MQERFENIVRPWLRYLGWWEIPTDSDPWYEQRQAYCVWMSFGARVVRLNDLVLGSMCHDDSLSGAVPEAVAWEILKLSDFDQLHCASGRRRLLPPFHQQRRKGLEIVCTFCGRPRLVPRGSGRSDRGTASVLG